MEMIIMKRSSKNIRLQRESGFTLVEIMIASSLGLVLTLVLFEIILQSQRMADVMIMQSNLNSQAREVFELLMDGGVEPGTSTPISGYHGRDSVSDMTRVGFLLRLGSTVDKYIWTRETRPPFDVTCTSDSDPIETCGTNYPTVTTYTVDGYIDAFGSDDTTRTIDNRTSEVTFTIIDPQHVPRDNTASRFIKSEYSANYWTVFSTNTGS